MPCFSTSAIKLAGVYRARADLAKCGLAEMKFSGRQCRLVKLQRPPPEIKIFLPRRSACSSTATRRPRMPASMAHINPAAPPPRIRASKEWVMFNTDRDRYRTVRSHVKQAEARHTVFFQKAL